MTFLALNDYELPVESIEQMDMSKNNSGRSANHFGWSERIFVKNAWRVTTNLMTLDAAQSLVSMLKGRGHYWSFNSDLYSTKGLTDDGSGSWALVGSGAKFGSDCVEVDSSIIIALPATYENQWTVGIWTDLGAGAWQHRLQNSLGDQWQDGVKGTYAGWDYSPTLSDFGIPVGVYDDLVILPYAISVELGNSWPLTSPWGPNPYLRASGDWHIDRPLAGADYTLVYCPDSPDLTHVQVGAISRSTYMAQVSFTIEEQ